MEISRLALILAFSLGLIVGCTLSEPKARPKSSPPKPAGVTVDNAEKAPTAGARPHSPPSQKTTSTTEPDGLPKASSPSQANPSAQLALVGPDKNRDESKTTEQPKTQVPMELSYSLVTAEFYDIIGSQSFRFHSASPEIKNTTGLCLLSLGYNVDPKTANRFLAFLNVKVDQDEWKDFSVGLLTQSSTPIKFTETSADGNIYHNLTIEEIKPSGEKQRATIQYLFKDNSRKVRAITLERGLVTNQHEILVCTVKDPGSHANHGL